MYQIYLKDICTSRGGTYRIEVHENITIDEFKKKVFEKTHLPMHLQKFRFNTKYLNNDNSLFEQIDFKHENWVTLELVFRWNA